MATILVVEDERAIRLLVERVLGREGHDVRTASTLADGKRLFSEYSFDLLISDGILPDGRGDLWLEEVIRANPDQKALLMSGTQTATGYPMLRKPFGVDTLLKKVNEVLVSEP